MPRISILGLDIYTHGAIWDELALPENVTADDVKQNIIMQCAELPLAYTNGDLMGKLIGVWSRKNLVNWTRMYQALTEEYNPLHNYDRHEEWTDSAGSVADGTSDVAVAGFNDGANLTPRDNNTQHTEGGSFSEHDGRTYGNIGVTTSAQMIAGEIDVRVNNTIVDLITDSFKKEFCILIY